MPGARRLVSKPGPPHRRAVLNFCNTCLRPVKECGSMLKLGTIPE